MGDGNIIKVGLCFAETVLIFSVFLLLGGLVGSTNNYNQTYVPEKKSFSGALEMLKMAPWKAVVFFRVAFGKPLVTSLTAGPGTLWNRDAPTSS